MTNFIKSDADLTLVLVWKILKICFHYINIMFNSYSMQINISVYA